MCGLLALMGETSDQDFRKALDLQTHRGPDDSGLERVDGMMFGHRRLSIIDLSNHSKQPMWVGSRDLVGVFNGEIYNFKEIRQDLESKGYQFGTSSDTEVLLNAFHFYGAKAIEFFIGMFAFVIYDRRKNVVYAARDRLGIKPLYYKQTSKGLCFSSEVKSIQALDSSAGELDLLSVSSYFSYRYPVTQNTFVKGVNQLKPGTYVVIKNGKLETKQYWDCAAFVSEQNVDKGEAFYIDKLRSLFSSAVEYRTIADVPVGAYLSGGVDSSAVVAEMSLKQSSPVKTFTIGFGEEGFNEFEYAREVASLYNTDHHEISLSQEGYFEHLDSLIAIKDAPLGVPNEVPLYLMSKELSKKVKVVLSGEGADEIFGGYGRLFRASDDYDKLSQSLTSRSESLRAIYADRNFTSQLQHFLYLYRYTSTDLKAALFGSNWASQSLDDELDAQFRDVFDRPETDCYVTKMMYTFEKLHLPGLLQRVDATTMGASVEARVPFVDHRLVEFAFTIPNKYKIKWNCDPGALPNLAGADISEKYDTPKYILKKSFEDKLPSSVLYRKKMGFPVPLSKFLTGAGLSQIRDRLLKGQLVDRGILSKSFLNDFLCDKSMSSHKNAMTAWMAYNLEVYVANAL